MMQPATLTETARYWLRRSPHPPFVVVVDDRGGRSVLYAWSRQEGERRAEWHRSNGHDVALVAHDDHGDQPEEQPMAITEHNYSVKTDRALELAPNMQIPMESIIGQSAAVLGTTGSGKSMTVRRMIEQLLGAGLPMCIFDIEGEYHTLREAYDVLVFGKEPGETVDLPITAESAAKIAEASLRNQQPVIIDLSKWRKAHERIEIVAAFLNRLLDVGEVLRHPYHVVLEEAQMYIPQQAPTDATDIITEIATRGRKRGLGIILASQRAARVDKDVLTQAVVKVLHFVRYDTDAQTYIANIPSAWMAPGEVKAAAFEMGRGEALVVNDRGVQRVKVTPSQTTHVGYTPGIDRLRQGDASKRVIDASVLESFAALLDAQGEPVVPAADLAEVERLKVIIADQDKTMEHMDAEKAMLLRTLDDLRGDNRRLRDMMDEKDAEIAKLKAQIPEPSKPKAVGFVPFVEGAAKLDDHRLARWPEGTVMDRAATGSQTVVHVTGNSPLADALHDELDDLLAKRDADYQVRMIRKQEKEFADLQRAVRQWIGTSNRPTWQRDFVHLLRKHGTVSKAQVLNWLRIAPGTFSPPKPLIAAGLVRRDGPRTNYTYTWIAPKTLAARFPDLDAKELEARIVG